jgi:hypothetical protein
MANIRHSSRRAKQRGSLVVIYAAMVFVIMAFAGLAVDVGYLQFNKRKVQAAADAAAMGALREMERSNTDLTEAGQNDAALNGFTNGSNGVTVTIANPPTSGAYSGNSSAVQATVSKPIGTYFMRALGQSSVTVTATAVARTSNTEGSVGGCIFAMNATQSGSLTINGNVVITSACGALVNSSSASAFTMVGGSTFNLTSGALVGVVGPGTQGNGWSIANNANLTNATTNASELPVNVVTFSDPLANTSAPTSSGMTRQANNSTTISPSSTTTLNPGIYCGGIDVKGTATFNAGTYVLAGGGLKIESQAVVTGSGVMFYNTTGGGGWGCGGNQSAGQFDFNGGATITLSAPPSATPVGVLFFDDRSLSGLTHTINGNSNSTFDGAQYFLHSYLKFAGTNQTPGFTYLVADTITITGNANLGNDHSTLTSVNELAPASTGGGLVQ